LQILSGVEGLVPPFYLGGVSMKPEAWGDGGSNVVNPEPFDWLTTLSSSKACRRVEGTKNHPNSIELLDRIHLVFATFSGAPKFAHNNSNRNL
jgi:hypothetical protein